MSVHHSKTNYPSSTGGFKCCQRVGTKGVRIKLSNIPTGWVEAKQAEIGMRLKDMTVLAFVISEAKFS